MGNPTVVTCGNTSAHLRLMLFDFDGVILESADMKERLYIELVSEISPALAQRLEHAFTTVLVGSERRKVAAWLEEQEPTLVSAPAFLQLFVERLHEAVLKIPLKKGFKRFLQALAQQAEPPHLYIVSAAPADEIRTLLEHHHIPAVTFRGIFGSKDGSKGEAVQKILQNYQPIDVHEIAFFGDMPSDEKVAQQFDLAFVKVRSPAGDRAQGWTGRAPLWEVADFEVFSV